MMGCLGNVLWFVFGGCLMGASWLLAGLLWCITIIGIPIGVQSGLPLASEAALFGCLFCLTVVGIPFGMQCFKIAKLALMPFGAEVR